MNHTTHQNPISLDEQDHAQAALEEKMKDALTPGVEIECSPEEAQKAGAFIEDALTEDDAAESSIDLLEALLKEAKS